MPTSGLIPMQDKGKRCCNCGTWVLCPCCGHHIEGLSAVSGLDAETFCTKRCFDEYYKKRNVEPNEVLRSRQK